MKLAQLQEARYTSHPVIDWVESRKEYSRKIISADDVPAIVSELTKVYGEPDYHEGAVEHYGKTRSWYWTHDVDEDTGEVLHQVHIRMFGTEGHLIVTIPEERSVVHR